MNPTHDHIELALLIAFGIGSLFGVAAMALIKDEKYNKMMLERLRSEIRHIQKLITVTEHRNRLLEIIERQEIDKAKELIKED